MGQIIVKIKCLHYDRNIDCLYELVGEALLEYHCLGREDLLGKFVLRQFKLGQLKFGSQRRCSKSFSGCRRTEACIRLSIPFFVPNSPRPGNQAMQQKQLYETVYFIVKILNIYTLLLCTHLYYFFPVSIHSTQCFHCLLQLYVIRVFNINV